LAALHNQWRGSEYAGGHNLGISADLSVSPAIQIDVLKHSAAAFPLKNPGLITIPLSFIVGIAVSLLAPERLAQQKFADVEQQIHLGSVAE
jgi:Na+(H+)/acetate symporter ActP